LGITVFTSVAILMLYGAVNYVWSSALCQAQLVAPESCIPFAIY
jgi:hypothetical protein